MYKLKLSMPIKKRKIYLVLILAMLFLPLNTINLKAETKDCFEKLNRGVFQLNMVLDKALFKPIASGYSYLPSPIQKGVRNVHPLLWAILMLLQFNQRQQSAQ